MQQMSAEEPKTPPRSHASSPSYAAVLRDDVAPETETAAEPLTPPKSYNGTPPESITPHKKYASASDMLASIMNDIQQIAHERDIDDASSAVGTIFIIIIIIDLYHRSKEEGTATLAAIQSAWR